MKVWRTLLLRDLRLAARSGGAWAYGLVFMALFLTLCAFALGGRMTDLREIGSPLIWLALTFATLMSVDRAFGDDLRDGSTEQLWLSGVGYLSQASIGIVSFALIRLLPLVVSVPLFSLLFDLPQAQVFGLLLSMSLALPGFAGFGALAGALTGAQGRGGFLAIFLIAPLLVPLLIFGVLAATGSGVELRVLAGLSLLALAVSIPATAAALSAQVE